MLILPSPLFFLFSLCATTGTLVLGQVFFEEVAHLGWGGDSSPNLVR